MLYLIQAVACIEPAEPTPSASSEPTVDWEADADTDTDTDADADADADTDAEPVWVAPSDPALRYIGRWDHSDPDAPHVGWQGASIVLGFEGTAVRAALDPGTRTEYFRAIIDGDPDTTVHVELSPGVETVTVAEGLSDEAHTLELVKETYVWDDVVFRGLEIDGVLTEAPPAAERRLAFYGDSNLAGYSLSHEENNSGAAFIGSHFGLAGITARMFGAEYHNVSVSGETISGLNQLMDQIDWYDSDGLWDFTQFPADAVIINLGANDVGKPEAVIRAHYAALLDDVRLHHPDAHIVLFNGWGWDANEPANYTAEVGAGYGDDNLSVATFPWVFEQWHGCEYDHAGMAVVLAEHLSAQLGWEAGEPDVMSGYGVDGGVANGSFEAVAPFGGYGWRYFQDAGVSRVSDGTAHDGETHVVLEQGAEIHQPNPAVAGQTVTATVWLRGASGGEQVELTIDFRDQTMWTDPLSVTTETVSLTADWTAATITAQAPDGDVFHTRLTVTAASGTASVDSVSMLTK
ncbi:MAG: GDSL-type esterase/lipase family protein [Myxococcota bacterium]|nr:GDSL-type esterase/lipase family protein [Myxococcota bacterium]